MSITKSQVNALSKRMIQDKIDQNLAIESMRAADQIRFAKLQVERALKQIEVHQEKQRAIPSAR